MSKEIAAALVEVVRHKLGNDPSIEDVIAHLIKGRAINFRTARQHVVREEFFRELMKGGRVACDVEDEIAERHGISAIWVRQIRSKTNK